MMKTVWVICVFCICSVVAYGDGPVTKGDAMLLWYKQPASDWLQALPLGNGRMGAMVFGTVAEERLLLNEESLWAGEPMEVWPENYYEHWREMQRMVLRGELAEAHQYGVRNMSASPTWFRPYQPFGDLWIRMGHGEEVENYRRDLNLRDGLAQVEYTVDGVRFRREVLISAVDDVIAVRLTADQPGRIHARVRMNRDWKALASVRDNISPRSANIPQQRVRVTTREQNLLLLDGQVVDDARDQGGRAGGVGPGGERMKFAGRLLAQTRGGTVTAGDGELIVEDADEVLLLLVTTTDYNLQKMNFDRSIDAGHLAETRLMKAAGKSWEQLLADHLVEHREVMDRVHLRIGEDTAQLDRPTNERLQHVRRNNEDTLLVEQLFQYGRYLLMSSSRRPGRLPANLQGIWNIHMWPPWISDYHLNINLQMNYWPAQVANLEETMDSLNDWFQLTAERGREGAQRLYQANGWVVFFASNPFGRFTPGGSNRESQFNNGWLDPMTGAWMALTWWRHYEFTQNERFLREAAYPLLKGAAEFLLDYLYEDDDGRLIAVPSTSPENSFLIPGSRQRIRVTKGSTYHNDLSRLVFDRVIRGSEILGVDTELRERLQSAIHKIPGHKIGANGTIQEWREDYNEAEPGHRHKSHLLGLFPFALITPDEPELFEAARKSVERRMRSGGGHTGWSRAKAINIYARLRDGNVALNHVNALIRRSTASNLFGNHPPFQIDGNFGFTAGVAEMLIQSHRGKPGEWIIDLLPALPGSWSAGEVKGLRARGDFTVSIDWKDGAPERVTVKSGSGKVCRLSFGAHTEGIRFATRPGETYVITGITADTMANSRVQTKTGETLAFEPL
jgi:alpha-L-fucosidase 2